MLPAEAADNFEADKISCQNPGKFIRRTVHVISFVARHKLLRDNLPLRKYRPKPDRPLIYKAWSLFSKWWYSIVIISDNVLYRGWRTRPRWSLAGSSVVYTPGEVQSITPIRETVETRAAEQPDLRDVFLRPCWDDRHRPAIELHDLFVAAGVKVWFSEKDLGLGVPMMRAIDKGLANSRIGLVLVTPALLARLPKESVADKELSALLAGNRLVPIVHNTTYEALRNVSPMLASRTGLDTAEDSMAVIAEKISDLVDV